MTEPDLSRCALIPSNLSRRGHTRPSANDYECIHAYNVNIASKKMSPLAANRCPIGKWLSIVPLTCVELQCSLTTVIVNT